MIFADAGYWIAMWHPRDALHRKAMIIAEDLGSAEIVTTQLVLIEALDAMARMGEFRRRFAARMVRELEDNPEVEVVPLTEPLFGAAVERYAARPDQT